LNSPKGGVKALAEEMKPMKKVQRLKIGCGG